VIANLTRKAANSAEDRSQNMKPSSSNSSSPQAQEAAVPRPISPMASPLLALRTGLKLNLGLTQLRMSIGRGDGVVAQKVTTAAASTATATQPASPAAAMAHMMPPPTLALADLDTGLGLALGGHNDRRSYRYTERGSLLLQRSKLRIGRNGLRQVDDDASAGSRGSSTAAAASPEHRPVSDAISDNIVKLGDLGHGASGAVHKCVHARTLQLMAVKRVPVHDKAQRHQIGAEIKTLTSNMAARAASPGVVVFHDAFTDRDGSCVSIVMEYCAGGSLQDLVAAVGALDEATLASVAADILTGLRDIHKLDLLHRDIKPSNLLLDSAGRVKLADFGLVREVSKDSGSGSDSPLSVVDAVPSAHTFVGTAIYMSPERLKGDAYSYSSDVWSFGLSLLTLALGRFPLNVPRNNLYWHLVKALCPAHTAATTDDDNVADDSTTNSSSSTAVDAFEVVQPPLPPEPILLFLSGDNAAGISDCLRDFLTCCLKREPEHRSTVQQLLAHPFVAAAAVARQQCNTADDLAVEQPLSPHTRSDRRRSDDQRKTELQSICAKVCAFHLDAYAVQAAAAATTAIAATTAADVSTTAAVAAAAEPTAVPLHRVMTEPRCLNLTDNSSNSSSSKGSNDRSSSSALRKQATVATATAASSSVMFQQIDYGSSPPLARGACALLAQQIGVSVDAVASSMHEEWMRASNARNAVAAVLASHRATAAAVAAAAAAAAV
jgi:serine/threonine protein kinase